MKKINLATVGRSALRRDIIESPNFVAGKNGDKEAAKNIVDENWKDFRTEQLQNHITENTVFLTMPSTSKRNVIPLQFASKLSENLGRPFFNGDELFNTLHCISSKDIPRDKRVFNNREYSSVDESKTLSCLNNKDIIIIDDILTTGSSARNFKEFLDKRNFNVTHVVGLMGERRLELDSKTKKKLSDSLNEKNIGIDISKIDYITRTEAGGLIRIINSLRGVNGIEKFTRELQGIQRGGIAPGIRGAEVADRDSSAERKNFSNERPGQRVSINSGVPVRDEIKTQKEQKHERER